MTASSPSALTATSSRAKSRASSPCASASPCARSALAACASSVSRGRYVCPALAAASWTDESGNVPVVQVNAYPYDADTGAAEDTARFMAASVQLAADLQEQISAVYLTDTPQLLLDADAGLQTAGDAGQSVFAMEGYTVLCRDADLALAQKLFPE